jgi:hypothetical protein
VDSWTGSYGFKVENLGVDSSSEARNGVIEDPRKMRRLLAGIAWDSRLRLSSVSFEGKAR